MMTTSERNAMANLVPVTYNGENCFIIPVSQIVKVDFSSSEISCYGIDGHYPELLQLTVISKMH